MIDCMANKTILVVDDSEFDRSLLAKALLRKNNFNVIEANNGEQCFEILETKPVHLILMDIMMPGIYGTQVLLKIREKFNPMELPIIMVTSKADASDVVGSLQSGANDYITKPVNFEVMMSRISTHLKLAEISEEMSKLKEMAALGAMIRTYNHEINNPLAIAIGCLNSSLLKDERAVDRLKAALWRIADIVKKIQVVTEKKEVEFQECGNSNKMIKIK